MKYETIRWRKGRVELIDQRLLPDKLKYISCRTAKDMFMAIREMKIRGAPAIGIAAAYGVYLGVRGSKAVTFHSFKKELDKTIKYLAGARPTARNLFWALERTRGVVRGNKDKEIGKLKRIVLKEAHAILDEDNKVCRSIGENGKRLIPKRASILTHCNAGGLATGGYGTALGVIFSARGKIKRVYVDETRPRLQGARLTVWELAKSRIPATLICDSTAPALMAEGKIDAIIVGADRIASNGDAANKIGTYGLAVAANYHGIPFYVAAPTSTFDLSLKNGKDIPIEERSPLEVRKIKGKRITLEKVDVKCPAFDVTPAGLITAIITEKGIIKKPGRGKIRKTCEK